MTTKNLVILGGAAAVLVVAACLTGGKGKTRGPQLNGERLVGDFDLSEVASVEIGDAVTLVSGADGWTVPALQDYPGVTTYSTGTEPNRRTVVAHDPSKR